ncbi:MAG: hypothetical protein K2X59_00770, partial [Sphingomonas sp.]|nr:hypothetical protein [Sphingomonas sp.]
MWHAVVAEEVFGAEVRLQRQDLIEIFNATGMYRGLERGIAVEYLDQPVCWPFAGRHLPKLRAPDVGIDDDRAIAIQRHG